MNPLITVCIPAYNRKETLAPLLDSVLSQDYDNFNVLVCEDKSPQREDIRAITESYMEKFPGRITYHENGENLGFDANIRNLVELSDGDYCMFMGNDDLMCSGAISKVASAIGKYPDVGVVLRSYATFDGDPANILQTFRYFRDEAFFPAGADSVVAFYRRCVVIPGVTIHRREALKYSTGKFDGVLLYQIYLVANILVEKNGVSIPDVITLYRVGGTPFFGSSRRERMFTPEQHTPESSLHFIKGMIDIAAHVERERGVKVFRGILKDIGNYSYPMLSVQANKPLGVYVRYSWNLAKMGLYRSPLFYLYFALIPLLGPKRIDRIITFIKNRLGYTPTIGSISKGRA